MTTAAIYPPTVIRPDSLTDPIRATQHTFRTTLDALSWPGAIRRLTASPGRGQSQTAGNPWTVAVLLMMVDHEVSFAVEPAPGTAALAELIQRRARAALAPREVADVVVADVASLDPSLPATIRRGTLQYPDDSATLIVQVRSLAQDDQRSLRLTLAGPGIDGERELRLPGIPAAFFAARAEAVAQYPMGIDVLFVDDVGRIVGLPRTTRVTIWEEGNA